MAVDIAKGSSIRQYPPRGKLPNLSSQVYYNVFKGYGNLTVKIVLFKHTYNDTVVYTMSLYLFLLNRGILEHGLLSLTKRRKFNIPLFGLFVSFHGRFIEIRACTWCMLLSVYMFILDDGSIFGCKKDTVHQAHYWQPIIHASDGAKGVWSC